jgi:hypothetical protein
MSCEGDTLARTPILAGDQKMNAAWEVLEKVLKAPYQVAGDAKTRFRLNVVVSDNAS